MFCTLSSCDCNTASMNARPCFPVAPTTNIFLVDELIRVSTRSMLSPIARWTYEFEITTSASVVHIGDNWVRRRQLKKTPAGDLRPQKGEEQLQTHTPTSRALIATCAIDGERRLFELVQAIICDGIWKRKALVVVVLLSAIFRQRVNTPPHSNEVCHPNVPRARRRYDGALVEMRVKVPLGSNLMRP